MSETVIKVENLSKLYRLGELHKRPDSFREKVTQSFRGLLSRKKLKATCNNRHAPSSNPSNQHPMPHALRSMPSSQDDFIWALKDISFQVERGEILGIIGRNGAGKSTLLKILSRITKPTEGKAWINGRVGSLLEVGTGFHPELTGRENIYLNGAILGMSKTEIRRKFDEIVAFADVEKFMDTPVKRYSSGMHVRLAFAVAAHLEPEILLVDEVLAVGDAAFQKKCLGKMQDIGKEGRTVLFVSHNMNATQRLCPKSLMLDWGQLTSYGPTHSIVDTYLSKNLSRTSPLNWFDLSESIRKGTGEARFLSVCYSSLSKNMGFKAYSDGPLEVSLLITSDSDRSVSSIAVTFHDNYGTKLINADTISIGRSVLLRKGHNIVRLKIEKLYLNSGFYKVGLWLAGSYTGSPFDHVESAFEIEIVNCKYEGPGVRPKSDGLVSCSFDILSVS